MNYPVTLTFKLIALAPQIFVRDASGNEILYVRQKLLKLKEKIHVFSDSSQSRELYQINADRVLDISARYTITDPQGRVIGAVQRRGMKSFWKASYEITTPTGMSYEIEEENPWAKVLDGLIGEIPVVGLLSGLFLHPRYRVQEVANQRTVLRITKHRSLLESRFEIAQEPGTVLEPASETAATLGILLMTLLERERG